MELYEDAVSSVILFKWSNSAHNAISRWLQLTGACVTHKNNWQYQDKSFVSSQILEMVSRASSSFLWERPWKCGNL